MMPNAPAPAAAMLYRIHRYPVDLIDVMRLPGGRITIRPMLPQDGDLMQAFVRTMSPRSRRHRFLHGLPELPPAMLERLTDVDHKTQVALLGEVFADENGTMISEARYVVDHDRRTAEFAVATADAWQRQGIARTLLTVLERSALAAGVRHLVGVTLIDNVALVRLARGLGFSVSPDRDDATLLRLEKAIV